MNQPSSLKTKWRAGLGLAMTATAIYGLSLAGLRAADPNSGKTANAEKPAQKKPEKKKFSGADLYAMHRCFVRTFLLSLLRMSDKRP